jgi:hypothetical protein
MRDVFDPHMTVEDRGVFHSCLGAVDDAPLPRGYHSLQQLADAVQEWYLAELTRRDAYPCHVAKSTGETLDVKWINAQEVTTSKHELRSFCDRLWLSSPARVEMMTNNTAPGVMRYAKGGSTKLAGYVLESVSDQLQIREFAEQVEVEFAKPDQIDIQVFLITLVQLDGGLQHLNASDQKLRNGCR